MNRNSFVNNREEKKTFMRRIRLPFGIALFLTGFYAVTGLISPFSSLNSRALSKRVETK